MTPETGLRTVARLSLREKGERGGTGTADETEECTLKPETKFARWANCCVMRASAALSATWRRRGGRIDSCSQQHWVTQQDPHPHTNTHTVWENKRGLTSRRMDQLGRRKPIQAHEGPVAHHKDSKFTDSRNRSERIMSRILIKLRSIQSVGPSFNLMQEFSANAFSSEETKFRCYPSAT